MAEKQRREQSTDKEEQEQEQEQEQEEPSRSSLQNTINPLDQYFNFDTIGEYDCVQTGKRVGEVVLEETMAMKIQQMEANKLFAPEPFSSPVHMWPITPSVAQDHSKMMLQPFPADLQTLCLLVRDLRNRITQIEQIIGSLLERDLEGSNLKQQSNQIRTRISSALMDELCLPVYQRNPSSNPLQLNQIVRAIHMRLVSEDGNYNQYDSREILSLARGWFRGRREDDARVIQKCFDEHYRATINATESQRLLHAIKNNEEEGRIIMEQILKSANIKITEPEAAFQFTRSKIISILLKLL